MLKLKIVTLIVSRELSTMQCTLHVLYVFPYTKKYNYDNNAIIIEI